MNKTTDQWGQWMAQAQHGDEKAYRALLHVIQIWLSQYFARRVPEGRGDDLVQETMIALHRKRHTYDPDQPFGPWLAAIARYKWIDWLRVQTRRAEVALPVVLGAEEREDVVASATIEKLLLCLKPKQSEVIKLVKVEGASIKEAAVISGQSEALVKVNIHRGMQQLIKLLEDADGQV